jgi:HAD superfamily phosphoserine phosphatase-like hydrolase
MKKDTSVRAVIFDIDGTLTEKTSWEVLTKGFGASFTRHRTLLEKLRTGKLSTDRARKLLLRLWFATGRITRERLYGLLETIPLHPEVPEAITYLKSRGYILCLITGSLDAYAELVARKLDIPYWYANATLHWDSKGNLKNFDYTLDQAATKLKHLALFCDQRGISPHECVAVGDSRNDLLLFKETKRGVAVRTPDEDKELEAVAWRVIGDLSELKTFL